MEVLAFIFEPSQSSQQKEIKQLHQTITLLQDKGNEAQKVLKPVLITERKVLQHAKLSNENCKQLDNVQNYLKDQDRLNKTSRQVKLGREKCINNLGEKL